MLNLSTNLDVVWKKPGYLSSAFGLGQVAWFFQTTSRLVDRFIPYHPGLVQWTVDFSLEIWNAELCWLYTRVFQKNILDLVYMHPGGVRSAMYLFYFEKSANQVYGL